VWGEEAVEQLGSVLEALEPVGHDGVQVVETVDGELADAAFEV